MISRSDRYIDHAGAMESRHAGVVPVTRASAAPDIMATREMTNEACCRHLARPPPGRVALTRHAQPLVISVNHVTDADTIVFRAGATSGGGRSNDSLVMRRPGLGGDGCSTAPASTDDDRPNTVIACADCGCIDEREVVVTPCDGHRSAPAPTFRRVPQVRGWVTESASNARSRCREATSTSVLTKGSIRSARTRRQVSVRRAHSRLRPVARLQHRTTRQNDA